MIPFVTINLDKPRRLRYGLGASITFEQMSGVKLASIGDDGDVPMKTMAYLLLAGLSHEDKDLTLDKVVQIVDDYADDLASVIGKITEAINAAYQIAKNE